MHQSHSSRRLGEKSTPLIVQSEMQQSVILPTLAEEQKILEGSTIFQIWRVRILRTTLQQLGNAF